MLLALAGGTTLPVGSLVPPVGFEPTTNGLKVGIRASGGCSLGRLTRWNASCGAV